MNKKMRLLYDTLIGIINKSDIPIEAKRIIAENICYLLSQKADEIISQEINEERGNGNE